MGIKSARFVVSNQEVSKCPKVNLPEYAFIGRSNVGKSSLINMLTNQKKLAKTSGRPGKTQLINHFLIDKRVCCFEIVEINPCLDNKQNAMAESAMRILENATNIIEKRG